jgi:hypothetical protein
MGRQFLQPIREIPKTRLLSHRDTPRDDGSIDSQNSLRR